MGLVQRVLEAKGFPTVALSMIPDLTRAVGVPRLAGVSHPMGRPLGRPHDADGQRAVLRATLEVLTTAQSPDTYVELPFVWPESPAQARNASKDLPPPPIVELLRKKPWLAVNLYTGRIPHETFAADRDRGQSATVSRLEGEMAEYTPDFSLDVQDVKGFCPVGEAYAKRHIAEKTIPVLTCEGPCIRGDIARLAGDLITHDMPGLARACHGETFFVPHSSMAAWVKQAEKVVMIDGCFLKCHGRVLKKLVPADRVVHIDALPLYNKYTNVFAVDDVPEPERKAVARDVADKIIFMLKRAGVVAH